MRTECKVFPGMEYNREEREKTRERKSKGGRDQKREEKALPLLFFFLLFHLNSLIASFFLFFFFIYITCQEHTQEKQVIEKEGRNFRSVSICCNAF